MAKNRDELLREREQEIESAEIPPEFANLPKEKRRHIARLLRRVAFLRGRAETLPPAQASFDRQEAQAIEWVIYIARLWYRANPGHQRAKRNE